MDDFEKAVRVVFAQADPTISVEVREQATQYCDAIKRRPDGWRLCWDRFAQRQGDCVEMKFWCLQVVLEAVPTLTSDRQELRDKVLLWLRDATAPAEEDPAIKNKFALVYVVLVKLDYPHAWPTAWRDLLRVVDVSPGLVDIFLRVLSAFDEEVVSDEAPRGPEERSRCQEIRCAMHESDVNSLADCWYTIIVKLKESSPPLAAACVKVVGLYGAWFEDRVFMNEKWLDVICSLIAAGGSPAHEACDCFGALISRKIPAMQTVHQFETLQIMRRLDVCVHRATSDLFLLEKEAELFNSVAECVLEAYMDLSVQADADSQKIAQNAWQIVMALMPFIIFFFSHQEFQMADSVEPFLTQFFTKAKSFVANFDGPQRFEGDRDTYNTVDMEQVRPLLTQILPLIVQRLAYPDWFQHSDPDCEDDERHIAFLELRRSLSKIFRRVFLLDDQLALQFLEASVTQLTQNLSAVRPMEVEAMLFLLKETGDMVKDLAQQLQSRGPLAKCFLQILECEPLLKADHWAIQLALLELYVRYGKIFTIHAEVFQQYGQCVVEAFVSGQGIRSNDSRVVARACFMFVRFVKITKQQIAPFAAQIYDALKDLLVVQYVPSALVPIGPDGNVGSVVVKGALKTDDQAGLYEAIASLVAVMHLEQMRPALQMLLRRPTENLMELLGALPASVQADPQGYASWAARSIEVIATISKAFSSKHAYAAPDWEEPLTVVARTLELFCGHGKLAREVGLWRSALFLCRRMVDVLGDHFLGPLDALLPLLINSVDEADLTDMVVFVHYITCQYQKKMQSLLQKWLPMLFAHPYRAWGQILADSEQLKREKMELAGAMLEFLRETAQRCPNVLLEALVVGRGNGATITSSQQFVDVTASSLQADLANFLLVGVSDPQEAKALYLSASTWSTVIDAAIVLGPAAAQEAAKVLPLQQLLQHLMWSVMRMDFSDVQATKALGEVAAILRGVTGVRLLAQGPGQQQHIIECLQHALAAALGSGQGCFHAGDLRGPQHLCEALVQEASLKDIRTALELCASEGRALAPATLP